MRYFILSAAAALFASATAPESSASETETVVALYNCGDLAGCFEADTQEFCDGKLAPKDCFVRRRATFDSATREWTFDDTLPNNQIGIATVDARLRFTDTDERASRLEIAVKLTPCADAGSVAFLGYSEAGNIIIATNLGAVELLSPKIQLAHPKARVLIDPVSSEIIDNLSAPHDNGSLFGFQFYDRRQVYYFDRDRCLTAPRRGGGVMKDAADRCAPLVLSGGWDNDRGLGAATAEDVETAAKTLPTSAEWFGDDFASRISRIESDGTIVVNLIDPCT